MVVAKNADMSTTATPISQIITTYDHQWVNGDW
jgi:hypothetical protein